MFLMRTRWILLLCISIAIGFCDALDGTAESSGQRILHAEDTRESNSFRSNEQPLPVRGDESASGSAKNWENDPSVIVQFPYKSIWYYTDEFQHDDKWITEDPVEWDRERFFPDIQQYARYFRKSIALSNANDLSVLSLGIKTRSSFSVYINGGSIFSLGIPSFGVSPVFQSPFTFATPQEITLIFHTSSYPKGFSDVNEIAVVVYRHRDMVMDSEYFDAKLGASSKIPVPTTIDANGAFSTNYPSSTSRCVYDSTEDRAWSVTNATETVWTQWHWFFGVRYPLNGYRFSSSAKATPSSWTLLGSTDGVEWVVLDKQQNYTWGSSTQFEGAFANTQAYSFVKLEVTPHGGAVTLSRLQFFVIAETAPPPLLYPSSSLLLLPRCDVVSASPLYTPFQHYSADCSAPLPDDFHFSAQHGVFFGLVETPLSLSCTITAQSPTHNSSTVLSIATASCPEDHRTFLLELSSPVIADVVRVEGGNRTRELEVSRATVTFCVEDGEYELTLLQRVPHALPSPSLLSVYLLHRGNRYLLNTLFVESIASFRYTLFTAFPVLPSLINNNTRFFSSSSPPQGWFDVSFNDSAWLARWQFSSFTTSPYMFVRTSFLYSPSPDYNGVEITVFSHDGIRVYLNGALLFAHCLDDYPTTLCSSARCEAHTFTTTVHTLREGRNVLAAVSYSPVSHSSCFDVFAQFLPASSSQFPRDYRLSLSPAMSDTLLPLIDHDPATEVFLPLRALQAVEVAFTSFRNEVINRYCLFPGTLTEYYPRDWVFYGVENGTWTRLDTQQYVFWTRREYQCFQVPFQNHAYHMYGLSVLEVNDDALTNKRVSLAEIRFYFDDTARNIPPLSYIPSAFDVYPFLPFPQHRLSSPLYTNFTITPMLPFPVEVDYDTGIINGTFPLYTGDFNYTVSAVSSRGDVANTTVSMHIVRCPGVFGGIVLEFHPRSGAAPVSYRLVNEMGEAVDALESVPSYVLKRRICVTPGYYTIVLSNNGTTSLGLRDVYVRVHDGSAIVHLHPTTASSIAHRFYVGYLVEPFLHYWWWSMETQTDPEWYTGKKFPSDWSYSYANSIPSKWRNNYYLMTHFNISHIERFVGLQVNIHSFGGYRVYLNGVFQREFCVGDDLTYNRDKAKCKKQSIEFLHREVFLTAWGVLHEGDNLLSVQLIPTGRNFDHGVMVNAILLPAADSALMNGFRADDEDGGEVVFDNDPSTSHVFPIGARHRWSFGTDTEGFFTGYKLVADAEHFAAAPLRWTVYAEIFNFYGVVALHHGEHVFAEPSEVYEVHLAAPTSVSVVWLEVEAVQNTTANPREYYLADFTPFIQPPRASCMRDGVFPPALDNDYSAIPCLPHDLYGGQIKRLCQNGTLGAEVNECWPLKPKMIVYPEDNYALVPHVPLTPIVPSIVGAETEVITQGKIPRGMEIDPKTGVISGMTQKAESNFKLTIVLRNQNGEVSTVLYFYYEEYYHNYRLIQNCVIAGLIMVLSLTLMYLIHRLQPRDGKELRPKITEFGKYKPTKSTRIQYLGIHN